MHTEESKTEQQDCRQYIIIGPDGKEYNYSGVGNLYTSLTMSNNTMRVYCQECGMICAHLLVEKKYECFWKITTLAPHFLPPHIEIPGHIETEIALAFCFECCPTQHKFREEQEQRRIPIIL